MRTLYIQSTFIETFNHMIAFVLCDRNAQHGVMINFLESKCSIDIDWDSYTLSKFIQNVTS